MNDSNLRHTILFVDDEARITSALKAIFRREYNILVASSGAEALEILEAHEIDVLVSDQRMPNMLGSELLAIVSKKYPQTMRILLTGFMDKKAIVDSINQGEIYRFINKPWDNDHIREIITEAALASEIPNIEYPSFEGANSVEEDDNDSTKNDSSDKKKKTVSVKLKDRAILMIEQQQEIRHQIRKFCNQESIMIYATQNADQAIAAATSRENIGLAIVELSNNTDEAIQTINLLKRARPELITIALTEEFDAHTAVDLINQGQVFKYLAKPLNVVDFQKTIEHAFMRHNFLKNNKTSTKRFKVEKTKAILSDLKGLFARFAD